MPKDIRLIRKKDTGKYYIIYNYNSVIALFFYREIIFSSE
jgi:hypothetical protein